MNSPEDYFAYLESMATNHKAILHTAETPHFFRVDINELDQALRKKANFPLIAVPNPSLSANAEIQTNTRIETQGSLLVLQNLTDVNSITIRNNAETTCFNIALDCMHKMLNDRKKYEAGKTSFALPGLNANSFSFELVPNQYTSFAGVLLVFTYNAPAGMFDPNKWNNETKYTP